MRFVLLQRSRFQLHLRLTQRRCKLPPATPHTLSTNHHEVHFVLLRAGAGGCAGGLRVRGPDLGLPRRIVWFGEPKRGAGARQRPARGVPDGRARAFHRRQLEDEPPGSGFGQGLGQAGLHAPCCTEHPAEKCAKGQIRKRTTTSHMQELRCSCVLFSLEFLCSAGMCWPTLPAI